MEWSWRTFESLTACEVYEMLALRQRVFVVEQACAYLDADGLDGPSLHLLCRAEDGTLVAYARLTEPGAKYAEPSIGRVVVAIEQRGQGVGRRAIELSVEKSIECYPKDGIRLSAQQRLEALYAGFGFETVRGPYDEDGIPHLEMLRSSE